MDLSGLSGGWACRYAAGAAASRRQRSAVRARERRGRNGVAAWSFPESTEHPDPRRERPVAPRRRRHEPGQVVFEDGVAVGAQRVPGRPAQRKVAGHAVDAARQVRDLAHGHHRVDRVLQVEPGGQLADLIGALVLAKEPPEPQRDDLHAGTGGGGHHRLGGQFRGGVRVVRLRAALLVQDRRGFAGAAARPVHRRRARKDHPAHAGAERRRGDQAGTLHIGPPEVGDPGSLAQVQSVQAGEVHDDAAVADRAVQLVAAAGGQDVGVDAPHRQRRVVQPGREAQVDRRHRMAGGGELSRQRAAEAATAAGDKDAGALHCHVSSPSGSGRATSVAAPPTPNLSRWR